MKNSSNRHALSIMPDRFLSIPNRQPQPWTLLLSDPTQVHSTVGSSSFCHLAGHGFQYPESIISRARHKSFGEFATFVGFVRLVSPVPTEKPWNSPIFANDTNNCYAIEYEKQLMLTNVPTRNGRDLLSYSVSARNDRMSKLKQLKFCGIW